ncbi:AAA family ATPase [Coraliomargarita sp. SDUM461004]|uniref:AAA family ATPase n=1 Tax=Thalassobacterium sedimentorum TaxID=3041258 RepID=A0ABU1AFA0_9BACT|nr:AAA family ATPase [Coraliomargarita sp. SDUM461004]MDQ8193467.1 AAA family ATPase [Coraliomargarita sp. SDUM461004]
MAPPSKHFTEPDDTEILTAPRNKTTKRIFIAATRMNDGKTTTSLALFAALRSITERVGFIKPVGQRFVEVGGHQIDEDSVLLNQIFDVNTPIHAMSPIVIHHSFTRDYLDNPTANHTELIDKMCRAFDRAAFERDYIIIEGTGHAGVGAVFDMSNADVARHLNAKVIIVARGGIGRPVDEIALNKAVFEAAGVQIIGAIINKVEPDKIEMVEKYCRIALERMNIPLLGCIPHEGKLTQPNLQQVVEETNGRWLNGKAKGGKNRIDKVIIGAMAAKGLVEHLDNGVLIITPGDREDIILSAIASDSIGAENSIAGIILTRSILPHPRLMEMIAQTSIPVVLCAEDSYKVASKVNNMTVKTQPSDDDKIPIIKDLITKNIDLEVIQNAFDSQE